ncbi:MAG: hypothetical protein AAF990_10225 [Bacteroidota bacterium]
MMQEYWKSILALILMPFAFYFNLADFYFAILFLIWSFLGIRNRSIYLLDHVSRDRSPLLFWVVVVLWIVLSILSLAYSEPFIAWYYGY